MQEDSPKPISEIGANAPAKEAAALPRSKKPTGKEWRCFYSLVFVQAQNAFNEKAAQFILIPLGVWLAFNHASYGPDSWVNNLQYILGCIFGLPYILFSPMVGWLSDRFSKTRIIQIMSFLQIIVLFALFMCFKYENIGMAVFWFCIFSIQATVLSPAKKGIVKDMIGSKDLGYASGVMEMTLNLSMLAAQIGIFIWFDYGLTTTQNGWEAASFPILVLGCIAIPVAILSLFLPSYAPKHERKFERKLFYEHFWQVKYLWSKRDLRLSEIGISFFYFLAGALILMALQVAQEAPMGSGDFSMTAAILMAWLSGGTIIGFAIASLICRGKIELGLIPLGVFGTAIACIVMAFLQPGSLASNIGLAIIGACGATFLVPLNAYLQDKCDPSNRSTVIAAGNMIDCIMGLVAVGFQMMLASMLSVQDQYWVLAALSIIITVVAFRLIPHEFIRMMGLWMMRIFYRSRIIHQDRIPEEGGALIVANHVTYGDALFLSMVCPRPIRFIVAEEFVAMRWLGWILELFNCLPISTRRPREALSKAVMALKEGEVICIFPEGQLTRTGTLCAARRGVEMLAHKSGCPIIPIYMDELWGSIFSYSGNRFFSKFPKSVPFRFTAAVGTPIPPDDANPASVINTLRTLSSTTLDIAASIGRDAVLERLERIGNKTLVLTMTSKLSGYEIAKCLMNDTVETKHPELSAWLESLLNCCRTQSRLCDFWMNAQQLTRVNALQPGEFMLTDVGHDEAQETVISVLWPILTGTPVYLIGRDDAEMPEGIRQIAGGTVLRHRLFSLVPPGRCPFYDFSGASDLVLPNIAWRPCYATDRGIILAMSMKRSVIKLDDGTVQLGFRARTRGRLLPGFYQKKSSSTTFYGATLSTPYSLPPKLYLDEAGFLAELQTTNHE